MGQFFFASSAQASNFSLVIPGTFAFNDNCDCVTVPSSMVTVHSVVISCGVNPASPNTKLNFMLKHPECAAATSSSGFVPVPSANLELNEYCVLLRMEL